MRVRILAVLSLAGAAAVLTFSLLRGQERPVTPSLPPVTAQQVSPPPSAPPPTKPVRNLAALNGIQKDVALAAQRGAEWTFRMHGDKGRFLEGRLPALAQDVPGEQFQFVRQLHAAVALARAARYTGEERFAVRATQAVLALLEDTAMEENDSASRCVSLPAVLVNRVGATGLLVVAIHELPQPQKDLLDKSDQMCHFLRKQTRPDGSIAYHDGKGETVGVQEFPGAALCGLALSQRHRPAEWKSDLVKKALPYYRDHWKKHQSMAFVPLMSAAFAETHVRTKDKACGDFVFEMNDWLCGLQYLRVQQVTWHGGFMTWQNGQAVEERPTVEDAVYTNSLAQACRVAREQGDLPRYERYNAAVEHGLRFLMTLQYGPQKTNHYASWYRDALLGGFHYSEQDGNLRIDQTAQAVSAMVSCLEHVW